MDALKVVNDKPIFAIQIVLDRHQNIYKVEAGDLHASFSQAVKWANEVFSVGIKEKADVVVSIAPYPMDVDLYQSQKALDNGKWALKEGGTIIMVSKCRQGIGHDTFLQQLSLSQDHARCSRTARSTSWDTTRRPRWQSRRLGQRLGRTDLDPQLLEKANIRPFSTVQEAYDALASNKDAKVLFNMDGSITVPRVN